MDGAGALLEGKASATRSWFKAGGHPSIEKNIENLATTIKWRPDNMGWPRKQAEAYTLIAGGLFPLAAAVRERSKRYSGSMHVLCEALAQRAKQMTQPAPLVYHNLTGEHGVATNDPAWQALLQPGACAGLSFVTNGLIMAAPPTARTFPDDKGYYVSVNTEGKHTNEIQDSDVVCFRSASLRRRRLPLACSDSRGLVQPAAVRDGDPREGGAAGRVGGACASRCSGGCSRCA